MRLLLRQFPLPSFCPPSLAALLLVSTAAPQARGADQVLFPSSRWLSSDSLSTTDADVTPNAATGSLLLQTGHQQPWPGLTLRPPGNKSWDLSVHSEVLVKVKNLGTNEAAVACRVDNPGADGTKHCVTGSLRLKPHGTGTITVVLKRTRDDKLDGKLFGMRGYPATRDTEAFDPANVTALLVFLDRPKTPHTLEISEIRAAGNYVAPTASTADANPYFPLIDQFGQYRHKTWPGKVLSVGDLGTRREQEAKALLTDPGPANWDKFGGAARGPQLKATGFFRTEKFNGKWWLVDPEGHLFFSHGIDCVRMTELTAFEEREHWYELDFSGLPEFIQTATALKGHYAGRSPRCFAFNAANLSRKYGPGWRNRTAEVIHQRLRHWGLNTIGNWSDAGVYLLRRTPYVDSASSHGTKMVEGSEGYWGKFPDVFDPSFKESVQRTMRAKVGKSAADPWCIGFFSDNEMSWGEELSLSIAALRSGPEQAAKRAFLADLKTKYNSDVAKLNEAWGTTYRTWAEFEQSRETPDRARAKADLEAFYTKTAETYFRTVREAIKETSPNHLYLGCRFAWVNRQASVAAAKYCDVVSYNLYQRSVSDFEFNSGADVPLIIGEFHFGALDRGMFHTGLVPVTSQTARAKAYQDYVEGALHHPQFVGCHWFQYQDQPTTGRSYDEENYQIGFVDIADTPYPEIIAVSRDVGNRMYSRLSR